MLNGMYMHAGLYTVEIIQLILIYQKIIQFIQLNCSEK